VAIGKYRKGTKMDKPAYNIITMSKSEYLRYHWARTEDARIKLRLGDVEWQLIWSKNYYQETRTIPHSLFIELCTLANLNPENFKVKKLDEILKRLDNSETPIDKLAEDIKLGVKFIKELSKKLKQVETEVKDAFKDLEEDSTEM